MAGKSADREIELKLACDVAQGEKLLRTAFFREMKKGRARRKKLHSIYFDTDDLLLGAHGYALRIRRDGRFRIQTLKTGKTASLAETGALAHDIGEYEALLPEGRDMPDLSLLPDDVRAALEALLMGKEIRPSLETDIERVIHDLETPEGDKIELALDRGWLRANGAEAEIAEIELELKSGDPASLYRLALHFNEKMNVRIGYKSKAERGFALLHPKTPGIVKAGEAGLIAKLTVEEAFVTVLQQCVMHLTANEEALLMMQKPEAVHQMRVALRRLRSAFKTFSPVIGGAALDRLGEEAKWLATELGHARDMDVFLSEIVEPVALPDDAASEALLKAADGAREEAWAGLLTAISSPRYTRFLLECGLLLAGCDWETYPKGLRPVRNFVPKALDRQMKKVSKRTRHIEKLNVDERHELRKALKQLRYALHFFGGLYAAKDIKPWLTRLSRLQDVFGSLNDVATAEAILRRIGKGEAKPAAEKIMQWHGKQADKAWKKAVILWSEFEGVKPFWLFEHE